MTDDHSKRRGRQEKSNGYEMPFLKMVLIGLFAVASLNRFKLVITY